MKNGKMMWRVIAVIVLALIPVLWYLLSPLFIDVVVHEEMPSLEAPINTSHGNQPATGTPIASETAQSAALQGTFSGADSFHRVEGIVKIVDAGEKRYVRLEDFKSTNGPDLKVWLAKDTTAKEYVALGPLKGNIGDQNYEIPWGTNLSDYPYVLIWCEKFGVLFGSARLS